jgi:hypothetical protein
MALATYNKDRVVMQNPGYFGPLELADKGNKWESYRWFRRSGLGYIFCWMSLI